MPLHGTLPKEHQIKAGSWLGLPTVDDINLALRGKDSLYCDAHIFLVIGNAGFINIINRSTGVFRALGKKSWYKEDCKFRDQGLGF